MEPQKPKPSQSKDPKAYHHWYWHNVRKPKLELEHPERYTRKLSKALPAKPEIKICSFTGCGKEFIPKHQKQKCCSQSCSIKLGYDLKHGITRKPGEEYCHICEKVKPREEFTVNRQKPTGHGALCVPCHNNYYNQKMQEKYKNNPEKYRDIIKQTFARNPEKYKARRHRNYLKGKAAKAEAKARLQLEHQKRGLPLTDDDATLEIDIDNYGI